jgi:hypothetical protein
MVFTGLISHHGHKKVVLWSTDIGVEVLLSVMRYGVFVVIFMDIVSSQHQQQLMSAVVVGAHMASPCILCSIQSGLHVDKRYHSN